LLAILIALPAGLSQAAPPLPGAIFTTTVDGSVVNENVHYEAKEDVYLDGGPGPNAPSKAAGLPEGDYFFQVTDPSGKDLLSTDHISCRQIHVNANGVIDFVYAGTNYEWSNKDKVWNPVPCQHNQGVDIDHSELGAITVQLFPYDDTPNPGGVYKVWVTRVEDYAGDPNFVPADKRDAVNGENYQPANYHGFIPAKSKTDNYKVKQKGKPYDPPVITVRKFHDQNLNGIWDAGEEEITGWAVDVADPTGVLGLLYTPNTIVAEPSGAWAFTEETPAGTLQTTSYLDGAQLSLFPAASPLVNVAVEGTSGETHEIVYGNIGVGSIEACKVYDRNGNGIRDDGEPTVPGWQIELIGTDITGAAIGPILQTTGESGCTAFDDLLPGTYTVTELQPAAGGWAATGPTSFDVTIESSLDGAVLAGTSASVSFTNVCFGTADFGTKGYWHNKNGLSELTEANIAYVNSLTPYDAPSSYFDDGDEPFDGFFADGTPVAAAFNNDDNSEIWGAGTFQAEVSLFLVDANAGGDPREQLAQQLLAFIFNAQHRLDDPGATIELPDGTWSSAADLITKAIAAWESGTAAEQTAIKDVLDALNNSDAVQFIHYWPCSVAY
jgi:hypothetical protein